MSNLQNPLREWRGQRSQFDVACALHITLQSYYILEETPRKSKVKSNTIIRISKVTGIPLAVLVDYLTSTNTLTITKEMA